jgi:hypothetical protein
MFNGTVSAEFAAQIESSEVSAWLDMYSAAPADFRHRYELDILRVDNVVLTRCKTIPFIHFNCVMNLGMTAPATEALLDRVLKLYDEAGIQSFACFHIPHSQPASLPVWFEARNLNARGGWDRIYRDNSPILTASTDPGEELRVEKVTQTIAPEWATYICQVYGGLPTEPWLLALVGRPGWHHYALRKALNIVAVRSMYIHHDGMAWLGVDAPVPGLMAPTFDLDALLCYSMVKDGLALGVRYFVTDIEATSAEMNTPAYRHFEALGFKRPYFREHYCR